MISKSLFNNGISQNKQLWAMMQRYAADSSTGPISYIDGAGEIVTVPAEQALYFDGGYWNVGSFNNYLTNPLSPATQITNTLGTGNYTLWNRGGSVTVSAGTAVITGAGTATEGNPLHFSIIVAGTVNVVVSGACTVFQLTATKFSTEPFLSQSVSTVASRAGTIAAPMEVGNKLYSLLGGNADGDELTDVNTDFSIWANDNPVGYIVGSENGLNFITEHFNGARIRSNSETLLNISKTYTGLISGIYQFEMRRSDVISGNVRIRIDDLTTSTSIVSARTITNWTGNFRFLLPIGSTDFKISIFRDLNVITDYVINNWSVKKVSPPWSKIVFRLTPYFNHSDVPISTTETILHSGTQPILQFRTDASGNGYVDLKDGTNTASIALDWEYGVSYDIEMLFGYNVAESADKMQLIIDSVASALTNFDGSLNPDTEMTIGEDCDELFFISKPIFDTLKQSEWR